MKPAFKWTLIILGIIIVLALIYFAYKAFSSSQTQPPAYNYPPSSSPSTPSSTCVQFTQAQYDSEVKKCYSKCNANLAIPVVGVGLWNKCMSSCKAQINGGKGVIMC